MDTITTKRIAGSDIVLGEEYRDPITGFQGVAIATTFWLSSCERVGLRPRQLNDGKVGKDEWFDAPELIRVSTETRVTSDETGGPPARGVETG